ncbi:hypothetical protein K492DRAFT_200656 [Lichtheimia hyalospora FSU 10163]|nr:hypothetical protein K492DRAFT_200656 [Lichtheimia hyalospora FSU 10163]
MHFSPSLILLGAAFVLGVTAAGEAPTDSNAATGPAKKQTVEDDYNKDVAESTYKIQQYVEQLYDLHRKRSLALMRCAQFDTTLRDADAIQKLDPSLHVSRAITTCRTPVLPRLRCGS